MKSAMLVNFLLIFHAFALLKGCHYIFRCGYPHPHAGLFLHHRPDEKKKPTSHLSNLKSSCSDFSTGFIATAAGMVWNPRASHIVMFFFRSVFHVGPPPCALLECLLQKGWLCISRPCICYIVPKPPSHSFSNVHEILVLWCSLLFFWHPHCYLFGCFPPPLSLPHKGERIVTVVTDR